jgi:hypothetical protein
LIASELMAPLTGSGLAAVAQQAMADYNTYITDTLEVDQQPPCTS